MMSVVIGPLHRLLTTAACAIALLLGTIGGVVLTGPKAELESRAGFEGVVVRNLSLAERWLEARPIVDFESDPFIDESKPSLELKRKMEKLRKLQMSEPPGCGKAELRKERSQSHSRISCDHSDPLCGL